jgi:MFS family permease
VPATVTTPTAGRSILGADFKRLRSGAIATAAVFALSGGLSATWVSRLPEIRNHLQADPGSLGLALLFSAIGSIMSTFLTGRLVRRFGSRPVVAGMTLLSSVAVFGLAFAPSVGVLGATLFCFGFGFGSWDVAMNVQGHAIETQAARAWMPRYHALWSVGGFVFAGTGALLSHLGVPIKVHFGLYMVLCLVATGLLLTRFFDERPAAAEELAELTAAGTHNSDSQWTLMRALIPLGIVMACATLIEGAASDWLGIYFNTERDVSPAAGSLAFTLFSVSMALARGVGTQAIDKLGRQLTVQLGGVFSLVGVAVLLLSPALWLAYVGAAFWGLGVAIVFPAVISAAGDHTPGRAAEAIALVTPVGYSGFLFGPPAIGLLARHIGLENSLWVVGALAILIVVLGRATRERKPAATVGDATD